METMLGEIIHLQYGLWSWYDSLIKPFLYALSLRPHMLFPHPRTHMGGGHPHAISPL